MRRPVAIVDYGVGNLHSAQKAFEHLGCAAVVTSDADVIAAAPAVVLPGQGAFGTCMANLGRAGLVEPVREAARSGRPFLGICVGMQLLFEESEESPGVAGLGVFEGRVVRFPPAPDLKVPHMGWNQLRIRRRVPALAQVADGDYVYFVHSYYPEPRDPSLVATTTEYGVEFASSVARDNVYAGVFHPEKSQRVGLALLAGFTAMLGSP
ncbi:MAG TPA: imidazole glycerol phosphate synthase subunit HisH [Candidatus Limnocylindria bacterium]|nr:imidazole glycerol phosphate synthase subunit HisH [Candidatus Limnocylindria bacterium]